MTVYEYLLDTCKRFSNGKIPFEPIAIDLDSRTIRVGLQTLVQNGKIADAFAELDGFIRFDGNPYLEIERLYAQYKRSVPTKRERINKGPFKALSSDQLTMWELENNMPRMEARVQLEAFICLGVCEGLIPWHIPNHFFWQGSDPDCIIYRKWILNDTKEETTYE